MLLNEIAVQISKHQREARELDKITLQHGSLSVDDAYEIQRLCVEQALASGDSLVGWKMGLTSKAKQRSMGVEEAIYGRLLSSMELNEPELKLEGLIHPRIEPEIAFVFKHKLEGPSVTPRDVWLATECIMPSVEVIDSRYRGFSFTLVDVVADNASGAKFYIGNQGFSPYQFPWNEIGVTVRKNGEVMQTGAGAAVLGHPVQSVVELVRMLSRIGACVEPGMVVLTGGITEAVHVSAEDRISVEFDQLGELEISVQA